MFNRRLVGTILYSLGICVASIGATKLPAEGATWSDMVYLFNDGVILTIVGLVIWRLAPVEEEKQETENKRSALQLIRDIQPILDDLYRNVDDLECYQIQEYVKILRAQYLMPLEQLRGKIMSDKGMDKAAELLIAISYGERVINRIHSAALDGHHDEAVECTEEAHAAFKEVFEITLKIWEIEPKKQ